MFDLRRYGLEGEPVIREAVAAGADWFSQRRQNARCVQAGGLSDPAIVECCAGILCTAALRADKLALAALERHSSQRRGGIVNEVPALGASPTLAELPTRGKVRGSGGCAQRPLDYTFQISKASPSAELGPTTHRRRRCSRLREGSMPRASRLARDAAVIAAFRDASCSICARGRKRRSECLTNNAI